MAWLEARETGAAGGRRTVPSGEMIFASLLMASGTPLSLGDLERTGKMAIGTSGGVGRRFRKVKLFARRFLLSIIRVTMIFQLAVPASLSAAIFFVLGVWGCHSERRRNRV